MHSDSFFEWETFLTGRTAYTVLNSTTGRGRVPKADNIFHALVLNTDLRYAGFSATSFPKI